MVSSISDKSYPKEIPVIDVAPLFNPNNNSKLLTKTGDNIKKACKNVGYFYITNHQIPQYHLDTLIKLIRKFFN